MRAGDCRPEASKDLRCNHSMHLLLLLPILRKCGSEAGRLQGSGETT